jgi:hypothetical protein
MSHKLPDGESCNNYFKYGKSFPENVQDAICEIDGAIGPTGPMGPAGPSGSGIYLPATVEQILAGSNTDPATYVDASGWYHASNRYAPIMETLTLSSEAFIPNALDFNFFDITYAGNCTISAPTNMKNGRTISLCLRQGAGGNHNLTWDPVYHFDGGYNSVTYTDGAKDVMVGTKINEFVFSTMANDIRASQ